MSASALRALPLLRLDTLPLQKPQLLATALLLAVASPCALANAADTTRDSAPKELDKVVVTATKHAQAMRTAPASVSVVDRAEISQQPSADLLDVVQALPGITLAPRQVGGRKTFSIRGLEGKHTLTLIDGRRISASDDTVGHSDYQYGWLPLSAIEQVEVIRGPLSALYGSEALGGVVNMITRWPKEKWEGDFTLGGETTQGSAGGNGGKTTAYLAGPLSKTLALRLNATHQHISPVSDRNDPRYSEIEGRDGTNGGATLMFSPNQNQTLELGWQGGHEDRQYQDVSSSGTGYTNTYQLTRSHAWAQWKGNFKPLSVQLQTYRSAIDIENSRSNGVTPTRPQYLRDQVVDGLMQWHWGQHALTAGTELRRETLINAGLTYGRDSANHKAVFLQDEITLSQTLSATLGLRRDQHALFGGKTSPRAYLVWAPNEAWVIKGGFGTAFKAPTLKQISPNYVGAEGPHTFYGNPNVRPENARSAELGTDWQQGAWSVRATAFRSDINDLITTVLILQQGPRRFYRYDNVNRARIQGAELGFTWEPSAHWRWNNDLTLLHTRDRDSNTPLLDRPRRTWNSQLRWMLADWQAQVAMQWVGDQVTSGQIELPGYRVFNARVQRRINAQLSWHVGIENFTNLRLADESPNFGYAIRGRVLEAGVQFGF
jgi:outer membrane receptor for ferrienterochelin and colicins